MAVGLLVVATAFAGVATAEAEPLAELHLKIAPKRTDTPEKPRGVTLSGRFHGAVPNGVEAPIMLSGKLLLPRRIVFNGGDYATCPGAVMRRDQGVGSCPKRSIMGKGRGSGFDEIGPKPTIVFVNGGARRLWAFTTFYNPALVREPVGIRVTPLVGGKWGSELSFTVPSDLQIVAGIPITVQVPVSVSIGGKPYAKEYIATTRRCPARGFMRYRSSFTVKFNDGRTETVETPGRIPCS